MNDQEREALEVAWLDFHGPCADTHGTKCVFEAGYRAALAAREEPDPSSLDIGSRAAHHNRQRTVAAREDTERLMKVIERLATLDPKTLSVGDLASLRKDARAALAQAVQTRKNTENDERSSL